jgi:hypothetical protein
MQIMNKLCLAMVCRWEHEDDGLGHLVPECSHTGHVLALYVDTRGDFIVVGKLYNAQLFYNRVSFQRND